MPRPQIAPDSIQRVASAMLRKMAADDDPKWFVEQLEAASQTLKDAVDVADMRGGLSDNYGAIAAASQYIRRNLSRDLHGHITAIQRRHRVAAGKLMLRQVQVLMRKHNLPGELSGRGTDWTLEVPNERAMKQVQKIIPGLGGYRTGYGGWVLSQDYQSKGDWNDPSSQWHYADGILTPEQQAEVDGFGRAADGLGVRLIRLGFRYDREPESRGFKGLKQWVWEGPNGISLLVNVTMRSLARVLGLSFQKTYVISVRQMENNFRVMNRWELKPRTLQGFVRSISSVIDEVSAWMTDVKEGRTATRAKQGNLFVHDRPSDIEFLFDPFTGFAQVGMGGEWWNSTLKLGKNVIKHRKERVDEAYRPVTVQVDKVGHKYRFAVMGGFGGGATFMLGF